MATARWEKWRSHRHGDRHSLPPRVSHFSHLASPFLACSALDHVLGGSLGQPWFAMLLATYGVGSRAATRGATLAMSVMAVALLAVDLPRLQDGAPLDEVLPGWFIIAGTFGFGRWMRSRRADAERLRARTADLERDRELATREAVAHERARIARELHDLVAHSLAVIVLQAQAAGRVLDRDVDQARQALSSVEDVGREGLAELRRLLGVLETTDPEEQGPRPSLRQLDELAARVRDAGTPVDLVVEGTPRSISPGLDLSAYRIVQEALTNTLKHAGPTTVRVRVHYLPEALEVEVEDDGRRQASTSGVGRGLVGMRERAHLYGGTLLAEPGSAGGFRVRASFPLVPA